jgi:hypothetical protein
METLMAFEIGQKNRDKELMVFDWFKAAELIKKNKNKTASAGLSGDWEYTGGKIYENGKPVPEEDTYVYLASTWAVPQLKIKNKFIDCFLMESKTPNWNEKTYWPEEALKILND